MGNSLVVMVVREENLGQTALHVLDKKTGKPVPVEKPVGGWFPHDAVLHARPDAFFLLQVPPSAVWELPEEPRRAQGGDWHWKPRVLASHRAAVRRSLEAFLNRNLEQLDEMARSGWFVIQRVRARISELREVPHHPTEKRLAPRRAR